MTQAEQEQIWRRSLGDKSYGYEDDDYEETNSSSSSRKYQKKHQDTYTHTTKYVRAAGNGHH